MLHPSEAPNVEKPRIDLMRGLGLAGPEVFPPSGPLIGPARTSRSVRA